MYGAVCVWDPCVLCVRMNVYFGDSMLSGNILCARFEHGILGVMRLLHADSFCCCCLVLMCLKETISSSKFASQLIKTYYV